jgi:hypothetical protein
MTKNKKLKEKITDLEEQVRKQNEEIGLLKKKTKKHKWLILASLFDK